MTQSPQVLIDFRVRVCSRRLCALTAAVWPARRLHGNIWAATAREYQAAVKSLHERPMPVEASRAWRGEASGGDQVECLKLRLGSQRQNECIFGAVIEAA